jgi:hypothetical protein
VQCVGIWCLQSQRRRTGSAQRPHKQHCRHPNSTPTQPITPRTPQPNRRVFVAPSKEEAAKWLGAVQTAMKNRYLYRRETLTGLSFLQAIDEGPEATRPRILLLSLLRGGADAAETVVARNVDYETGLALPPLLGGDRLLLTFVNGATAQLSGGDVVAHAQGPKDERLKAPVVGGGLAGSLTFTTTLVKQGVQEGAPPPPSPGGFAAAVALLGQVARALLLQPEHAVPLLAAGSLLAAAAASLTDRRQQVCLSSFQEACQELKFGTMVFVALALLAYVLLSLLLLLRGKGERGQERGLAEREAAQGGPALAGIYLEVCVCVMGMGWKRECGHRPSNNSTIIPFWAPFRSTVWHTNRPTNEPTNQPTKQPTNHPHL